MAVTADQLMVFSRGTDAATHVLRTLLTVGDEVAAEALGHPALRQIVGRLGARIVPVELNYLERAARSPLLRAVWVTPHCQYPTTVETEAGVRRSLMEVAHRSRLAVIEFDHVRELQYGLHPPRPLAAEDDRGQVIYIGSLTHVLAPEVQLAYVAAAPDFIHALSASQQEGESREDRFAWQFAAADLIEDGDYRRGVRRTVRAYRQRRDCLAELLRRRLLGAVRFEVPSAGPALWVECASDIDLERWVKCALDRGVLVRAARHFAHDGVARPFLRLGFTELDEAGLQTAVEALAVALDDARRPVAPEISPTGLAGVLPKRR